MNTEDFLTEIEINYKQIISMTTLMLENNSFEPENLLTLIDLAQKGLRFLKQG